MTVLTTTVTTLIILLSQTATSSQSLNTETHNLGPFSETDINKFFKLLPMASIENGSLQLTPTDIITPSSGRVFLNKPFNLWRQDQYSNGTTTTLVASFNTSFLFTVSRVGSNTPGEGLAFLISPSLSIPPLSAGQYLGLTGLSSDGDATNQIVAVEFDTVRQRFDPDDNHVGLDINSVNSNVSVPLSQYGIQIAGSYNNGSRYHVVWVEYDGVNKMIDVYMALQPDKDAPIVEKPLKPVLSSGLDLKGSVNQMSYFGFSASTGDTFQRNTILRWNSSVEILSKSKEGVEVINGNKNNNSNSGSSKGITIMWVLLVVFVSVLVFVGGSGVGYWGWKMMRERAYDPALLSTLKKLPGTPREFGFEELKKATDDFDERNKLGQGGFGVVYRGVLAKEKVEVAVKKFSSDSVRSTRDFLAELTIINRLRHRNLVRLMGWCHKNGELMLVYDYMPNGSLDKHIFCKEGTNTPPLSWHLRYKIILGVASALNYLHNEYDQTVVHRDLKASNIMLDSDFNARLGDFGLARALENEKTWYAELKGVLGTRGYIAPECIHKGKATCESDVYGFGAVLLEVACGQRPWTKIEGHRFLVDWVWHLHGEGRILEAMDPRLGNNYVVEEAERVLKLGLACSHSIANERPKMQRVVQILYGLMPVPNVPLLRPTFVWPAMDVGSSKCCFSRTLATFEYTPINTDFFAR